MKTVSRKQAKASGEVKYFTGKPCVLGCVSERKTKTAECLCEKHRAARSVAGARLFQAKKSEIMAKRKGKDRTAEHAAYYAKNKRAVNEKNASNRRKNPARYAAYTRKRQAAKLNATPPWFGELDELVMEEAYDLAKRREAVTGEKWEVDHIIPLQGKTVCGLHVWNNVQVIPQWVNRSKSNRHTAGNIKD